MTTYRTGNHNARHIYRGDEEIAVAFAPEDGALIVEALNEIERAYGPALPIAIDSCTGCTSAKGDPGCPVHQGRKPRGPKPPPLGPGCICDGSGRTCPRHGAVM